MEPWQFGLLFKAFGALIIIGIAFAIRYAIHRYIPEGKFKTFVLKHRFGKHRDAAMR